MSDGDVLRRRSNQCGLPDVADGYMSEGGAMAYRGAQDHHNQ